MNDNEKIRNVFYATSCLILLFGLVGTIYVKASSHEGQMAITGDLSAPQQQAEEEIIDVEEPKEFIQKVKLVEGQRRLPKTNEKSNSWLMSLGCLILLTSLWLVSKIKSATDVTK